MIAHVKITLAIAAALICGAALAEVDQNGCRNTAKKGYVCKPQSSQTWERKRMQKERADKRQAESAHDKNTVLYAGARRP